MREKELSKNALSINCLKSFIEKQPSITHYNNHGSGPKIGFVVTVGNTANDLQLLRDGALKGPAYFVGKNREQIKALDGEGIYYTDIDFIPTAVATYPLD